MCETCAQEDIATTRSVRRKLWEIEIGWHCTIIGTCVSMAELRGLSIKLGVQTKQVPATDYEIHSTMVYWTSRDRRIGKAIHKLLERKHAVAVSRFSKFRDSEGLARAWREAVERGEVAGALWALMSHPGTSADLQNVIFGEVHMLSHQIGATSRADLRRSHLLEKENAEFADKVARQQERLRTEVSSRDEIIRQLRGQLDNDQAELRRLAHATTGAAEFDGMRALVSELQRHLNLEGAGRRAAECAVRELAGRLSQHEAETLRLREEAEELRNEIANLEGQVLMTSGSDCLAACDQSCGRPDLCGRCILYVGGRANHVPHLRRIVEECNGTFMHHDGGFEESMGRLNGLLGQADTVMFPVDCVSHMAHDQLKRLCKRWEKPFVPVRRSGLGAFIRALEAVGAEQQPAPAHG